MRNNYCIIGVTFFFYTYIYLRSSDHVLAASYVWWYIYAPGVPMYLCFKFSVTGHLFIYEYLSALLHLSPARTLQVLNITKDPTHQGFTPPFD